MSRSAKKGPYIYERLIKKIQNMPAGNKTVIKTWARHSTISPEMVGHTFAVHNGKDFINVYVTEGMVGYRFGEFAPSTRFKSHGGKMAKDQAKGATAPVATPVAPAKNGKK